NDATNKLPAARERNERRDVPFLFLAMSSSNQIVTDVRTASSRLLGRRGDTHFRPTANRIYASARRVFRRTSPSFLRPSSPWKDRPLSHRTAKGPSNADRWESRDLWCRTNL